MMMLLTAIALILRVPPLLCTHALALLLGFALGAWALRIRVRFWRDAFERQCGRRLFLQRDLERLRLRAATRVPAIVQRR